MDQVPYGTAYTTTLFVNNIIFYRTTLAKKANFITDGVRKSKR